MLELSRGRAVTPSSPAGEAKTRERGEEDDDEVDLELLGRIWKPK